MDMIVECGEPVASAVERGLSGRKRYRVRKEKIITVTKVHLHVKDGSKVSSKNPYAWEPKRKDGSDLTPTDDESAVSS